MAGKGVVYFTAECGCGWSYGPSLQTDVLQMVKFHRKKGCDYPGVGIS